MVGSGYITRFREANNRILMKGKNVLVVGGTGGIGAAAALKFSQLGASVTIGGRSKSAGEEMIAKMRAESPCKDVAQFHYLPVDITVMPDVKRFARDYMEINKEGLHTLVVTSGGLNVGNRREVDGIEHNFAICYLGRFLVINRLLPLLIKGAEDLKQSGEASSSNSSLAQVRVLSILSAGVHGEEMNLDDLEMKKPGAYGKVRSANYNSLLNDFMMEELTKRHENIGFFHLAPGAVATDIMKNNGIPAAGLLKGLLSWAITSPADYAEVLTHIATNPEFNDKSGKGVGPKGQGVNRHKYLDTPGAREKVWAYSTETSGLDKD